MGRSAASIFLLSAIAVALAGCLDDKPSQPVANIYPAKYREEIIATLKINVFKNNETTSVSNAFVSEPVLQQIGKEQHYVACVRYTARGTAYNLTADATRIGYFYGGHLNQLIEASKTDCANAVYKPFPELNEFCIGQRCK